MKWIHKLDRMPSYNDGKYFICAFIEIMDGTKYRRIEMRSRQWMEKHPSDFTHWMKGPQFPKGKL
jgi:hypothetical protein